MDTENQIVKFAYTDSNGMEREPTPDELQANPDTFGSDGKKHKPRRQRISYWRVVFLFLFGPIGFFSISIVLGIIGVLVSGAVFKTTSQSLTEMSLAGNDPEYYLLALTIHGFLIGIFLPIFLLYIFFNNSAVEERRKRVASFYPNKLKKEARLNLKRSASASARVDTDKLKAEAKAEIKRATSKIADTTDQTVGKSLAYILSKVKKE